MGVTPRFGIPYPESSDPNNVPLDVLEAVTKIDTDAAIDLQGLHSARPAAGKRGRYYWATDYQLLYRDDGAQWREIIRSIAWSTWTPLFSAYDGSGELIDTITVTATEVDARYRLIANGSQCEFFLRASVKCTGSSPFPYFGLCISAPIPATKEWVVNADCNNGIQRAFMITDSETVIVFSGGVAESAIGVFPISATTEFRFPIDNVPRYWRVNGLYEVAEPNGGATGDPPEEVGADWPYGAATGDIEGEWPNLSVTDDAIENRSVSTFDPPTANFPMNNKKATGQAKGTTSNDGATMQNLADHEAKDATADPHAAASYAKMRGGGRNIHVVNGAVDATSNVQDGDVEFRDDAIKKRKAGAWVTIAQGTTATPGENTNPTTPGSVTDVDRRADTVEAINQWFADFVNGDGWAINEDVSSTSVTSTSMAYGMLFAVLAHNQAKFDLIRDKANAVLKRSLHSETFAPHLWARAYTVGTGVTDWNSEYKAEYIRAKALARALQLWNGQKDNDDLSLLATDLEASTLNEDESRKYQVLDNLSKAVSNGHHAVGGTKHWEMSLGALDMQAHRILRLFTAKSIWDQVIAGDYDALNKGTDNGGGVPTSVGLPSDYVSYATDTHDVSEILNGSNGYTASRSRNFSWEALAALFNLGVENEIYSDTRALDILVRMKAWAIARWGTTNKFVTSHQQNDGAELSTTRKLPFAYGGYLAITANDPANATAANIKSTWLTSTMANNGAGDYFVSDPPGVTATSSFMGNTWMILMEALDNGLYAELGEVPGIAGKYNSTLDTGTTPGGGTSVPTTPLPAGAVKLAVFRNNLAGVYANALPNGTSAEQKKKARFMWLREQPQGVWTGPEWDASGSVTETYMAVCDAQAAWFTLIMYGIPNRDLGGASAGGSAGAIEYRNWCNNVISKIGSRPGIVVIEPDSIALMLGQPQADFDARMALINELVVKLRNQCPNARIYLDAAHAAWFPDPTALVDGLRKAGVARCHGIVSNVSNFRTDGEVIPWSENLLGKLNLPNAGFIWDVGRNGRNPAPNGSDWQNPMQTRFGRAAQFGGTVVAGNTRAHGALWIKNPGESDGNNDGQGEGDHGGPPAGQLFSEYLYNETGGVAVADNANGSTSGELVGSGNAGMLQRPGAKSVPSGFEVSGF